MNWGAGWGRMSLALAGVIDYNVIPLTPVKYRCLAVEGEPTHYQWLKEHFEVQKINGIAVHGAVSNKNGTCRFDSVGEAGSRYGQTITSLITINKMPSIKKIYNFVTNGKDRIERIKNYYNLLIKGTIKIPMYTIDRLIQTYGFDHVDIIHMDVQGAEYKVALGAAKSIENDLIDYLIIGTHHRDLNDKLRQLLSSKFDVIVNIYPHSVGAVNGFPPIKVEDGIQLYRRKNMKTYA